MAVPARLRPALEALELRVLVGVLAIAAAIWAVLTLGGEVAEGETGAFDRRIMQALRLPGQPHTAIGPPWLGEALRDVSALGGTTLVVLATLLAVAALVFHRAPRRAVLLAGVVAGALLADEALKALYGRARPDFALPGIVTYAHSFPSGHSTASAALWLSLASVAASFERRRAHKLFWFGAAAVTIVAVGVSRVYLGVHWPTDVLAGWMLGAAFALAGWIVWRLAAPAGGGPSRSPRPEEQTR
ncbi:MAG TPA: phosphatase PAP2 family protein [Caulobacteraceae bacterium]|nr:phosphatase PAP2 family protein [Caulobacteraceae bacterium]